MLIPSENECCDHSFADGLDDRLLFVLGITRADRAIVVVPVGSLAEKWST